MSTVGSSDEEPQAARANTNAMHELRIGQSVSGASAPMSLPVSRRSRLSTYPSADIRWVNDRLIIVSFWSATNSGRDHAPDTALEVRRVEDMMHLVVLEIDRPHDASFELGRGRWERRPLARRGLVGDLNATTHHVTQVEPTASERKAHLVLSVGRALDVRPALAVLARDQPIVLLGRPSSNSREDSCETAGG